MADSTGFGLKDIEYLVNGEYASGSNNTSSSAGILNRPLAQIDANVRLLASVLAHQHNSDGSLKDSSVVTSMLEDGAVTEGKLGSSSVTSDKISDGAVTEGKLGSSSVTSDKISDGAVTEGKLDSSSVTSDKISDGAVIGGKLASNSVSSAKIASNAVTEGKIANGAVTPNKTNFNSSVAMSSIEFSKVSTSAGHGGYINFHWNSSTADYTSRIIESANGKLDLVAPNGVYINGQTVHATNVIKTVYGVWLEYPLSNGETALVGYIFFSTSSSRTLIPLPKRVKKLFDWDSYPLYGAVVPYDREFLIDTLSTFRVESDHEIVAQIKAPTSGRKSETYIFFFGILA